MFSTLIYAQTFMDASGFNRVDLDAYMPRRASVSVHAVGLHAVPSQVQAQRPRDTSGPGVPIHEPRRRLFMTSAGVW